MILKVVVLFLIVIGVMAMFGKLRIPKVKFLNSKRCSKCGQLKIGKDCQCSKKSG